jgi:hypothetical protein
MQLSRRLSDAKTQEKELNRSTEQACNRRKAQPRQLFPTGIAPAPVPMRPDASPDPTVETLKELADLGAFVIPAPAAQKRIKFRDQLRGVQRYHPLGSLPYLIHKTTDRFLLGIRIERTLSGLTTNLVLGQMFFGDLIDCADIGMVQRGSCARLATETLQRCAVVGELSGRNLSATNRPSSCRYSFTCRMTSLDLKALSVP